MGNKSLNNAKAAKHDEFYTQLTDIEKLEYENMRLRIENERLKKENLYHQFH